MIINKISAINIPQNRKIQTLDLKYKFDVNKQETYSKIKIMNHNQNIYAVKIISKQKIDEIFYEQEYQKIYKQITILYQFNHQNIIKLLYHEETDKQIKMYMQYGGLKLANLIGKGKIQLEKIKNITKQLLNAIKYIHSNGYIHRNLSPTNILLDKYNCIRIIDFGYCTEDKQLIQQCGTEQYRAPQMDGQKNYSIKADIWSIGIIVYEMFHEELPFQNRNQLLEDNFKIQYHEFLTQQTIDFLNKMLKKSPQKRLFSHELLQHQFLKEQQQMIQNEQQQFNFNSSRNETQKKGKTNKIYKQNKKQKQQLWQEQTNDIQQLQKILKKTINETFANLHNSKHILKQIFKNYSNSLEKLINKRS